ncbi:MAG: hypothetical protein II239_04660 [Peptococcaceae bacterium]|nr:hypothetical protein [Peptococcaceae bacterium]
MKSYEQIVKDRMIPKYPKELLGGKFRGKAPKGESGYPHIFQNLKDNFIDGKYPGMKRLKGSLPNGKIHYNCATHMNSSQTMCISYFKKFFEDEAYEPLLAEILMMSGIDVAGTEFVDAIFEYEPNSDERTNFDFYLKLLDGRSISWEVKFTEKEFGGTTKKKGEDSRYIEKWKTVYIPMLRECAYYNYPDVDCDDYQCLTSGKLTDNCCAHDKCSIHEFYQHYQIRRNIAYAKREDDYVLFLTPRENTSLDEGRAYIDTYARKYGTANIRNIYWEDLLNVTLQVVSCNADLLEYYTMFKNKYFE